MARYPHLLPLTRLAPVLILAAGCASSAGAGHPGPAPTPQISLHPAGEAADTAPSEASRLQSAVLAFADHATTAIAQTVAQVRARDGSPEVRLASQTIQTDVASTVVALAIQADSRDALRDLVVSLSLQHRALGGEWGDSALGTEGGRLLENCLDGLESDIWRLGAAVLSKPQMDDLRGLLERWKRDHPLASFTGIVRYADLIPAPRSDVASKGLFAPLEEANRQMGEANRQLEQTRLLGERLLFLAQRLPVLARWQAEALTYQALVTPEATRALAGMNVMAEAMAHLSAQADSLPRLLDAQRHAVVADFDAHKDELREIATSGERVAGASRDAARAFSEAVGMTERLVKALRDASAPGGAASFDIERYIEAASKLEGAAQALNQALAGGQGLAPGAAAWVDHAAWRAAQLVLLFFLLLVGYRVVAWRLARSVT